MAQGYVPIQTITVGSGGSSTIQFTNIPQNYNDLKIVASVRNTGTESSGYSDAILQFNGTTTNYSEKMLYGIGSSPASASQSSTGIKWFFGNSSITTASTFSNSEAYISNYTSSNTKSISIDTVVENSTTVKILAINSGLWANSSAITSIAIVPSSGNWVQHSTVTLYGIGAHRASGGTITADSQYTYHTFTSSGTFTALENITNLEYLVVAGGGGGSRINSGGGAGGLRCTAEATGGGSGLEGKLKLNAGVSFSAIVGSGGSGNSNVTGAGTSGSSSGFMNIQSVGGGGGGSYVGSGGNVSTGVGLTGGSGGGGGYSEVAGTTTGGSGTLGQGFAGGNGSQGKSGGGGGAGAAGSAGAVGQHGGNGGNGVAINSFGYATNTGQLVGGFYYYAGGGGAGDEDYSLNAGTGGLGGGGNGANRTGSATRIAGSAGTANTGGGGGGGENGGTGGYNGGSGIVIIRYPN